MGKQSKIDKINLDIEDNQLVITALGARLVAFGGNKATRTDLLERYTQAVVENERLLKKRELLNTPWWNRI